MQKINFIQLILISVLISIFSVSKNVNSQTVGKYIVLDAGHGGTDPGAVGYNSAAYPDEKDFNLSTLYNADILCSTIGLVVATRLDDITLDFNQRSDIAVGNEPDGFGKTVREYYRNGQWVFFDAQPNPFNTDGIWGNNWNIFTFTSYGTSTNKALLLVEFEFMTNPDVWTIVEPIGVYYNKFYHRNAGYAILRAWDDYENWDLDPYNFSSSTPCQSGGDPAPQTPQNFAGTIYNNAPKVYWDYCNEPDIEYYEVWRKIDGGSWTLKTTTTSNSFTDIDFIIGGMPVGVVYYKIRAKDIGNNFSLYTSQIYFRYSGTTWKVAANNNENSLPKEYLLENNYPNPFNPSTQISYSLTQDADVTLRIYDILGTQVAELVNAKQIAGSYSINFNATNLSSGVYLYRIVASRNGRILYTESKQMILLR
ncbi:MAG: N-acetylmuramoyl-L-alanine amidase [Ignavibacteria bacterium]|nr:N-acetylmuramoyl-L-alanine amidase [Ignavibacteria bacterium]